MFRGERKFTPLSALEGTTVTSGHKSQTVSAFHFNLPDYVPAEQIGVNLARLHRDLRTGGIGQVVFTGTSGETTTYTPEIVSGTSGGSATAGLKATEKRARTYNTDIGGTSNPYGRMYNQVNWANIAVSLNLSEIQRKLSEKNKLRSAKAWSGELNNAMRKGVALEGIRHLLGDLDGMDMVAFVGGIMVPSFLHPEAGARNNILESFGLYGALNMMDRMGVQRLRNNGKLDSNLGFRWSLFMGPQLDRAGVLYARSKTSRVVKSI